MINSHPRLELYESMIGATEASVGIPKGLLRALVMAESGSAQGSSVALSVVPYDLFSRRYEPGFYQKYIQGTKWESTQWGKYPEVIASSYGLCQVMFTTAIWARDKGLLVFGQGPMHIWDKTPWTLFDPVVNLRIGAEVLRHKAKRYGGWDSGVAAYNAGSARADGLGVFVNQPYVDKVSQNWGEDWPDLS